MKHHLYATLLGLFVWSPKNDCVGQVVQSQNSTVAHRKKQKILNDSCKIKINQRTNGPVNAHLKPEINTNKLA